MLFQILIMEMNAYIYDRSVVIPYRDLTFFSNPLNKMHLLFEQSEVFLRVVLSQW